MRFVRQAFLSSLLVCLGTPAAFAQFDSGSILGTVRDPKGATVPVAKVTVRNNATAITATTLTDTNGDYTFPSLQIGNYRLSVAKEGFTTAVAETVNLTVNGRQRVDFNLQVGTVNETINVIETAALLESESSSRGQVIQSRQITELPVLSRNYSQFALLTPGVRESQSGNQGSVAFRREGAYNVNGLRSVFNNFILDGLDNNFYGTTNQGFSNQAVQPSPDSVSEFRMMVNAYSAEFGRTGGAVMNVASKSGTNEFHGSAWEFLQNETMNATGFFKPVDNRKPPHQAQPVRLHLRRARSEEPDLLLRRLRGLALAHQPLRPHLGSERLHATGHPAGGRSRSGHLCRFQLPHHYRRHGDRRRTARPHDQAGPLHDGQPAAAQPHGPPPSP